MSITLDQVRALTHIERLKDTGSIRRMFFLALESIDPVVAKFWLSDQIKIMGLVQDLGKVNPDENLEAWLLLSNLGRDNNKKEIYRLLWCEREIGFLKLDSREESVFFLSNAKPLKECVSLLAEARLKSVFSSVDLLDNDRVESSLLNFGLEVRFDPEKGQLVDQRKQILLQWQKNEIESISFYKVGTDRWSIGIANELENTASYNFYSSDVSAAQNYMDVVKKSLLQGHSSSDYKLRSLSSEIELTSNHESRFNQGEETIIERWSVSEKSLISDRNRQIISTIRAEIAFNEMLDCVAGKISDIMGVQFDSDYQIDSNRSLEFS